jgi:hypothetical protein
MKQGKSTHNRVTFTVKEERKDIYICVCVGLCLRICVSTMGLIMYRENNSVDPVAVSLYSL